MKQLNKYEMRETLMNFNRVWIRVHELPGGWLERHQADALDLREQFEITCYGLETHGHHVVLRAGQGHSFDEIFFFKSSTDAQEFFDHGFLKWESFIANDPEGCGFLEVSLHSGAHLIATKSSAPTIRIGVRNE
jgi:hypothetical protein